MPKTDTFLVSQCHIQCEPHPVSFYMDTIIRDLPFAVRIDPEVKK